MTFEEWDAQRNKGGRVPIPGPSSAPDAPGVSPALHVDNSAVDDLLAQAKGTLGKADAFSKSIGADRPAPSTADVDTSPTVDSRNPWLGRMYKATSYDSPASAAMMEMGRTVASPVAGVIKSPVAALKNVLGFPKQIYEGYTDALPTLARDPSLLASAPGALKEAGQALTSDPELIGSLVGQALLAPKMGSGALDGLETVARKAPDVVGRGVSAVGRTSEAIGKSAPLQAIEKLGPLEAVARADWKGLAATAIPPTLRGGGQMLQRVGARIQASDPLAGLMRAVAPVRDLANTPLTFGSEAASDAPRTSLGSHERVGYAVPSEFNDFNYEKPPTRWAQRPSDATLSRLMDADPGVSVEESQRVRAGLGAHSRLNKSSVLDGIRGAMARSHTPARAPDPDLQDALNEIMRRHYVGKP